MFSVPGWNVSASHLVREQPKSNKSKADTSGSARSAKKRKRDESSDNKSYGRGTNDTENVKVEARNKISQRDEESYRHLPTKYRVNVDRILGSKPNQKTKHDVEQFSHEPSKAERSIQHDADKRSKEKVVNMNKDIQPNGSRDKRKIESKTTTMLSILPAAPPSTTKLTPLQAKMRDKLTSARFRHLNETLYTTSSSNALELFKTSPDLFSEYHAGFSQQVKESWPQNPVDKYVQEVKSRAPLSQPRTGLMPLPRRKTGSCTIADLGCGDAPLARGSQATSKKLHVKFHSYDLHEPNSFVTRADISNLPLRDGEADIAVFCLSLMGTNWISFVEEAWRILRGDGKGEVWVAEVKSRFGRIKKGRVVENSVGKQRKPLKSNSRATDGDGDSTTQQFVEDTRMSDQSNDETDVSAFVEVFRRRGFILREGSINKSNKMFVSMVFIKAGVPNTGRFKGMKWNGQEYQKQEERIQKGRFGGGQKGNVTDAVSLEEETKVLKPCVYKIR